MTANKQPFSIRLTLIFAFAQVYLMSCVSNDNSTADMDGGSSLDADSDSDTDSDTDTDTDNDTDTDTDTGADDCEDGTFDGSIQLRDQEDIEALAGCLQVFGSLHISFSDLLDLSGLSALTDVGGSVEVPSPTSFQLPSQLPFASTSIAREDSGTDRQRRQRGQTPVSYHPFSTL